MMFYVSTVEGKIADSFKLEKQKRSSTQKMQLE